MEETQYARVNFQAELIKEVDEKIEKMFIKLKDTIKPFASNGHTSVRIFFTIKKDISKQYYKHDKRIDDFYSGIMDSRFTDQLCKKMMTDGVKLKIKEARCKTGSKCLDGYIFKIDWSKDFSNNNKIAKIFARRKK